MSIGELEGVPVAPGSKVAIPRWGLWFADLNLTEPEDLSGSVELTLGGQTLAGAVLSGGVYEGRASYRVVGGAGKWGSEVPARGYVDDAGVKVRNVLQDVADRVGETIAGLPATRLGPHYARQAVTGFQVLNALAPRNWYVDFDGVTQIGTWPESTYSGDGVRTRVSSRDQVIELSTEDLSGLVPGAIIDGSDPTSDVEWVISEKRLTARMFASAKLSRRQEAMRSLMLALFPHLALPSIAEFRVVTQTGERFNLQPARSGTGLPDLARVPVRPGVSGCRNNVTPGEVVLVAFADGDPSRPNIISHDAPDAPGWMPLTIELGGPGALGVARQTDAVACGMLAGTIVGGSVRVKAAL